MNAGHLPTATLVALRTNLDLVAAVCEWANVNEADVDDDGAIWVGGADGRWLSPARVRDFVAWVTMQAPASRATCDGCGAHGGTWEWPEGWAVDDDGTARDPMLCAACLALQDEGDFR